jgi:hypothetical protein
MKGPSGRVWYRVQRQWLCTRCGRQRATAGSVVHLRCDQCPADQTGNTPWLQLVEEPRRPPAIPAPTPPP